MEFMWVRKEIGQSGVAGHWWDKDGDVVEVPWDLGVSLLELKGAGFSQAEAPAASGSKPAEAPLKHAESEHYDPGLPGDVPDGTAIDVLDWVGVDKSRAAAALKAEKAKGGDARTSLVAKLEKLAG